MNELVGTLEEVITRIKSLEKRVNYLETIPQPLGGTDPGTHIHSKLYASDFEVPQKRRRTIIIGIRKDLNIIPKEPELIIKSKDDRIAVKTILLDTPNNLEILGRFQPKLKVRCVCINNNTSSLSLAKLAKASIAIGYCFLS